MMIRRVFVAFCRLVAAVDQWRHTDAYWWIPPSVYVPAPMTDAERATLEALLPAACGPAVAARRDGGLTCSTR